MTDVFDYHFILSEKIEKYRPKRNGSGDIEKCILSCEKGMDNLKRFVHRWTKEHSDGVPPSIACRDVLIRCYLIISEFDKAQDVVKRSLAYGAWGEARASEEHSFIEGVRESHQLVQDRVRINPGTMQRDIYAIFPNVNKDAMKWFLANTNSLIKRKEKNTYSLWLLDQDIPEESIMEITTIDSISKNNDEVLSLMKKDLNLSIFPDWYVSISFGQSTSKNYLKAVALAKGAPQYIETNDENANIIHQAVYSKRSSEYLSFISLYELINSWKSCFVVINGEIVDRKIIGGINYCYGDKVRSGNPDFCYGASQFTENPFGCHRLQISSSNSPWWTFGYFDNKRIWNIDKKAILERINEYSSPYLLCPAFSMDNILKELNALPDKIDPKKNRNWVIVNNSISPKELIDRNTFTIRLELDQEAEKPLNRNISKGGCFTTILSLVFVVSLIIVVFEIIV